MKTKIYIAAPFPIRTYAQSVMHWLESKGFEVTSRWLKIDDCLSNENALKDLEDVEAADVLLALNPAEWSNQGTGGRHVELGYALRGKQPVVILGERSNMFHFISTIPVFDDIDAMAEYLQDLTIAKR